jgi:hypothetical protein
MITLTASYRVRIENALDVCGHCAIETIIDAIDRQDFLEKVEAFMMSIGVASYAFEIKRIGINDDPSYLTLTKEGYLVGCHWRIEDVTRCDDGKN